MAIEKIAMSNVDKTIKDDSVDTTSVLDIVTADAYEQSIASAEHMSNVIDELNKTAEQIATESPETPEVKEDSIYTKKLTLDESLSEFDFSSIDGSNDDEDRYVEFDMFDFIYTLFSSQTDSLVRPIKALSNLDGGRGRKKADDASSFMYQGSDDYIDDTGEKGIQGVGQISTDVDGNVVLYQDDESRFDKVIELCNEYGFDYEGPTPKRAPWIRWNFSFKVIVPTYADGYPMDVEDYFDKQGIDISEVMPPEFIKGRAKDYKRMNDEVDVDATYQKYVRLAANSNDPLEGFIKDMFKDLDSQKVRYDRKELKSRFIAEFEDDFEDDE